MAFLLDSTNDRLKPINLAAETAGAYIAVGDAPGPIFFNSDGSRAYVSNTNSNNISVINTNTDTVVDTIALTGGPLSGVFNPEFSKVYIARSTADQIVVADGDTLAELSTIAAGDSPTGVRLGPVESATASVDFTLATATGTSSDEILADTGQNTYIFLALASMLLISPAVYLRKRYSQK